MLPWRLIYGVIQVGARSPTAVGWGSIYECTSQPRTSRINQASVSSLWILASDRYSKMEDVLHTHTHVYVCKSLGAENARRLCPRAMKPAMALQRRSCFLCKTLLKLDLKEKSVGPFPPCVCTRAPHHYLLCAACLSLYFDFVMDMHTWYYSHFVLFVSTAEREREQRRILGIVYTLTSTPSSWLSRPACFAFFKCPVTRQSLACQFRRIGYTHTICAVRGAPTASREPPGYVTVPPRHIKLTDTSGQMFIFSKKFTSFPKLLFFFKVLCWFLF